MMTGAVMAELRIGTSGYQYDHWRGPFYPRDLPRRLWFDHYASRFDCVEINNTFYHLPEARTFQAWHDQAPRGFVYALKFSRYGSHLKKLLTPRETIRAFLERARRLKGFLGPILVQLPPRWRADAARLDAFLDAAPRRHRWAVEVRDASWLCQEVYAVLRAHGAALCLHDLIEGHPRVVTAGWVYLRFHGAGAVSGGGGAGGGGYSPQALSAAARRIRRFRDRGLDVYAFFNNDAEGHAPRNAADLLRYLSGR